MTRHRRFTSFLQGLRHTVDVRLGRFKRAGTLSLVLATALSAALCVRPFIPVHEAITAGTVVTVDVVSRRDIVYVDDARTQEQRKRAMEEVAPIYTFDSSRLTTALASFESTVAKVIAIRSQGATTEQESDRIAALLMTAAGSTTKYLATCSESEVQSARTVARQALTTVMGRGVLEGNIAAARESINTELKQYGVSDNQVRAAYALGARFVTSNLIYDESATVLARDKAASLVVPIVATISAGTPVVKAGTTVDQATAALLLSSGLVWGPRALRNVAAEALVVILAWIVVALAALLLEPAHTRTQHLLFEMACMGTVCMGICWLAGRVAPTATPFFLCLLLGFVFLDRPLATVFGLALMFTTWIMVPVSAEVVSGLVFGALTVIVVMRQANKMSAILVAGPIAGVGAAAIYASLSLVEGTQLTTIGANMGYLVAGGLIAAAFAVGSTFIFERLFNVATVMRLRELLDTGNKLLAQLFESAPGTYHHSLNVANLAAGAAQRIGANWLLARVGGYYHDIGKLLHPQFFGENRGELPNIHEDISPELSTKVILEHVQAGVMIATSHHLPPEVIDIIAEHHGTTVVQFFYDKAAAEQANLSPEAFRYQGPRPHTRESSLVFLADGVEAAARSLTKMDKAALEGVIEGVVSARIADGQLAESQLTLGEIRLVKDYFLASLVSFYHVRDAYLSTEEANERA